MTAKKTKASRHGAARSKAKTKATCRPPRPKPAPPSGGQKAPSPNGANGDDRDPETGRFLPGNPGGPGNPYLHQVALLRSAILEAVTVEDVRAIVSALMRRAKMGDVLCAREVLNRATGRPFGFGNKSDDDSESDALAALSDEGLMEKARETLRLYDKASTENDAGDDEATQEPGAVAP
jgi:hypothetical protein